LVATLADGAAHSITELTDGSRVTRQAITKHLRVLQSAGVVRSKREGRESRFSLEPDSLQEATAYLSHVSAQWDRALARLRAFVERD
jgi:DNA-binding transcriptional ArsR family regulator